MLREKFLNQVFFLIFLIAILHTSAIFFYFYWTLWWYDVLLHFLGGIWIGLSSLWVLFVSGYFKIVPKKPNHFLFTVLIFTITVGILWELFEFSLGTHFTKEGYALDTMIDIVMDLAGGLLGYLFFIVMKYEKLLLTQK